MSNVGLIVAMDTEIPNIFAGKSGIYKLRDNMVQVVVSGIGQRKARKTTIRICTEVQSFRPDYLLVLGFCGGTHDELEIGELICVNRLTNGNQEIDLEESYLEKVAKIPGGTEFKAGKLQTFNWPVISRKRVSKDTIAVDMESFVIAETSQEYQIPTVVIKAVSDIVPEKANITSLVSYVRTIKANTKRAKAQLNEFAYKYFL